MRFTNFASFQDRQQMSGSRFLTGVRSCVLQTRIECGRRVLSAFRGSSRRRHRPHSLGAALPARIDSPPTACIACVPLSRASPSFASRCNGSQSRRDVVLRRSPFVRLEKTPRLHRSNSRRDARAGRDRHWRRPILFLESPDRRGDSAFRRASR